MGPVYKISQWNLACLMHKYSETSKPNFRGNIKFILVHWPLEMYSNSMCRQPAPVCPAMGEIRYNTAGNPWQNEKIVRNASKSSKSVWKYALSPPLIITTQNCQWCVGVNLGYLPPLKIPLISLWRWVARRPYKVLTGISTDIAW